MRLSYTHVVCKGWSGRKVHTWLKTAGFKSRSGKHLTLSNVYTILDNHFYHGTFEYPKLSGRWFQGKHTPLISKDLYDDVQKQLHIRERAPNKNREFAFTRILSCGACGSGVSAQEKYKTLKDGTISKYIYYGCTRAKDYNCKEGYIEEKVLIEQLLGIMDEVDLDTSGIKDKLEDEIERHNIFQTRIMGKAKEEYRTKDADMRNYAKYLLTQGSMFEKRDLLRCLKSRIILQNKYITIM